MIFLAWALTVWLCIRWLGLVLGSLRLRHLRGEARWQVKRWGTVRRSVTVAATVVTIYVWAAARNLDPVPGFASYLALSLMLSVAYWMAGRFMLPADSDPRLIYAWTVRGLPEGVPLPEDQPAPLTQD